MLFSLSLLAIGSLVSGVGTIIGFGGGVFMIPILVLFFQIKMQLAVGAVAFSLVPAALIATAFNSKQRLVDYHAALWLEIPTVAGAIFGAYLTSIIAVKKLELIFAIFLIFMAFKMIKNHGLPVKKASVITRLNRIGYYLERNKAGTNYRIGMLAALFYGSGSGVVAGMFGIGGGFLKTPVMIYVFGMPAKVAVATALLMIVFTSLTSTISHFTLGHIEWSITIPLTIGFIMGAIIGNLLKNKFHDSHTEKMITYGLLLAGGSILIHAFQN